MNLNNENIGEYDGYQIYRNGDGFLEGYKTTGERSNLYQKRNGDCKRVVTNATNYAEFVAFIKGMKVKPFTPKQVPPPTLPFID